MKILSLTEIKDILQKSPSTAIINAIEQGFVDYSQGKVIVPPVGELLMDKGEVHIKYGCVNGGKYYTIKVASGFYDNANLGLPTSNGLMLLFSQKTGQLVCLLHDEGHLTDVRTAIAGAIVAKYMAPKIVTAIGVIGAGIQARMQPLYLKSVTSCRKIVVWARDKPKLIAYKNDMEKHGFEVSITDKIADVCMQSNLIVTTTPSETPLINADDINAGTHITAVGSDTADKQELCAKVLAKSNLLVADSISQCLTRGEIFHAVKSGDIEEDEILELGDLISKDLGRKSSKQITIADLTGVAVQDIKIAEAIYQGIIL